jgi:tripartite-type tricarboxylate transporter receptor subunit TctC
MRARSAGLLVSLIVVASIGRPDHARAQDYPARPVTIIVPTAAGGGVDFAGRLVAGELQNALGKPFVVENKGGASGNIGTLQAARAAPDGYTLLVSISGFHTTNPALFAGLQWDPVRDFAGVGMIMRAPHMVVVNRDFPADTLAQLVAYARANPGKLHYASPGVGTQNQIAAELLAQLTGISITPVPYRGTGPALNDVLAGTVGLFINSTQSLMGPLQSGRLKGLAILSATRHPLLPDLPTAAEAGVPGLEIETWYALYAPAGTPRTAIDVLAREMKRMSEREDFQARVAQSGATMLTMGPDELDRFTAAQLAHWTAIIRRLGITAQ